MKRFTLIAVLALATVSCGSQKQPSSAKVAKVNDCPATGTCTVELLDAKTITPTTDHLGRQAYELKDFKAGSVLKYKYEKTRNKAYQDDFYSEEVVVALPGDIDEQSVTEGEQTVMFTVNCFCRGKAGTYNIKAAKTSLKNNIFTIKLPPNIIDNQVTSEIKISLK